MSKGYYTVATLERPIVGMGINGPITTPTVMKFSDVLTMVRNKYEVYQHNPVNMAEKVLVTLNNIGQIKFTTTRGYAMNQAEANLAKQAGRLPKVPVNKKAAYSTDETERVEAVEKAAEEAKEETSTEEVKQNTYNNQNFKKNKHNKHNNAYNPQPVNNQAQAVNTPDDFTKN